LLFPRWHVDGDFFPNRQGDQWKFATVLLGPGTLFLRQGDKARQIHDAERTIIAEELEKELQQQEMEIAEEDKDKLWWAKTEVMRNVLAKNFESPEWEVVQPQYGKQCCLGLVVARVRCIRNHILAVVRIEFLLVCFPGWRRS
jgi:hypothetical protein